MTVDSKSGRSPTGTVLIVALSGFLMGFDGSLFTGAIVFVKERFELGTFELGWTNASQTLSATLAIFLAGMLADRLGRRTVLRAAAVMFVLSAIVTAVAQDLGTLMAGRLLSGLGIGAVLVAGPMYIAEISPPALRGRMVTYQQLFIVIGIALAFVSNYFVVQLQQLDQSWIAALRLAEWNWRWMVGLGAAPALAYLFALLWIPESPRWLAMHGRLDAARRVLVRAHGDSLAEAELAEMRASLARAKGAHEATLAELWTPGLRRVLVIGVLVGVFQQVTGISSVLSYATVIFEHAGAGADVSFMQTVYIGVVNLVFTVLALLLIDRIGRRPLLLFGLAGMGLCLALVAVGFGGGRTAASPGLVLAGLLGFVASFAASLGPVMWVLLSEIFPNRIRALAISCVGLVNSTVCFLVQLLFPWQMERYGGATTFAAYGVFALAGLLLLIKVLPETRGRSLEELEESLVRRG
jgi:SP family arabinose:H+ symporter-like MFS transporter